jgi:hypothetical protein
MAMWMDASFIYMEAICVLDTKNLCTAHVFDSGLHLFRRGRSPLLSSLLKYTLDVDAEWNILATNAHRKKMGSFSLYLKEGLT